jgi:hypothetical protein
MPILVAFFAVAAYVFFSRRRQARKRAAWKEETDKRMSMASIDWQSMSAAGGAAAVRGSFQTNRTPRASVHTMLDGGVAPSPLRAGFASEDISQLGPRARALSAAATEGRPLSRSLVNEKVPTLPAAASAAPRTRSKSTAAMEAIAPLFGARAHGHSRTISASGGMAPMAGTSPIRPPLPRAHTGRSADDARRRTPSSASNNPFAEAMVKRDSQTYPTAATPGMAFPTFTAPSTPVTDSAQPRTRLDSQGRPLEAASRARVASRVSFADVLNERARTQSNLSKNRLVDPGSDEYGLEMQDALPALARESLRFLAVDIFRILTLENLFSSLSDAHSLQ